ncbi:MAG: glycoside hydrolase family 127 protein [Treponema sp.]|nr:glycoside hydrolase family 127 protein [Treponema sp.]
MDRSGYSTFVSLKDVMVDDGFWSPIMERVRTQVIPYQWDALNDRIPGAEPSYCMRNFKIAAELTHPELNYDVDTKAGFGGRVFQDSDLAKWVEAAAYSLVWHPDRALEQTADEAIAIVCNVQQADGYLNTYYIINGLDKRFTNLRDNHELYCLGHFLEGAVAYYEATGKRKLLDALIRYTDCVDRHIGPEAGKLHGYPGHEILEMALMRLYAHTEDERHLRLAKYFIDERGRQPLYFEEEGKKHNNPMRSEKSYCKYQYYQAGIPVREQRTSQGHAVRAVYLYSGMADVARITGDTALMESCNALWDNIVNRQMYITGSIGQTSHGEAFTFDYDLPNDTVYGETCAAIGLAFFARCMSSIEPKGIYGDILEKTLFNGIISGMSLDGKKFFYVNPLEVNPEFVEKYDTLPRTDVERQKWFSCACCPPNLARIAASLGGYAYSVRADALYSHLFLGNNARVKLCGADVEVTMRTRYPWEEKVEVSFKMAGKLKFSYGIRIPLWCGKYRITVNDADAVYTTKEGCALLSREWSDGDKVCIVFDMPVMLIEANPLVRGNIGKAAVMRGPIVYCLEEADNGKDLHKIYINDTSEFLVKYEPDFLEGIVTLSSRGRKLKAWQGNALYRKFPASEFEDKELRWIPYYAWANRKPGEMIVWVHKEVKS